MYDTSILISIIKIKNEVGITSLSYGCNVPLISLGSISDANSIIINKMYDISLAFILYIFLSKAVKLFFIYSLFDYKIEFIV